MLKNSLKILKQKVSYIRGKDKTKVLLTTHRDWAMLFIIATIYLFIIASINIYFSIPNNKKEVILKEGGAANNGTVLNVEDLDATIELFNKKAERFKDISAGRSFIVDPSR